MKICLVLACLLVLTGCAFYNAITQTDETSHFLAIAYSDVEFSYVNTEGEIESTILMTPGILQYVFVKWAELSGVTGVELLHSYIDSNCTTIDNGITVQRILGDEFILHITLSDNFALYRDSVMGEAFEAALIKTLHSYLGHITEVRLEVEGNKRADTPEFVKRYIATLGGTVTYVGPYMEWGDETTNGFGSGFYIQLDFIQRYCEYVDGMYVTSGIPMSVQVFIDSRNTLVLGDAEIKTGVVFIVSYDKNANEQQTDSFTAITISPHCQWVFVDYFDDNFTSACGDIVLHVLDDAVITYKDGTPFLGEISDLTNRLLAVSDIVMSATPAPTYADFAFAHMISSLRIFVL